MFMKLIRYREPMAKIFIVVGIALIILVSFNWNFGLGSILLKSIFTLDIGVVDITVHPDFLLALAGVFLFYIGYIMHGAKKTDQKVQLKGMETYRELKIKYLLLILVFVTGALFTASQFRPPAWAYLWAYLDFPYASSGALALRVDALLALLLLVIWYLVPRVSISLRREETSNKPR